MRNKSAGNNSPASILTKSPTLTCFQRMIFQSFSLKTFFKHQINLIERIKTKKKYLWLSYCLIAYQRQFFSENGARVIKTCEKKKRITYNILNNFFYCWNTQYKYPWYSSCITTSWRYIWYLLEFLLENF